MFIYLYLGLWKYQPASFQYTIDYSNYVTISYRFFTSVPVKLKNQQYLYIFFQFQLHI